MSEENKQWWLNVLERAGVPVLILFFMSLGIYRVAVWVAVSVVEPLVHAQIEQTKSFTKLADAMHENGKNSLLRLEATTTETLQILKDKQ